MFDGLDGTLARPICFVRVTCFETFDTVDALNVFETLNTPYVFDILTRLIRMARLKRLKRLMHLMCSIPSRVYTIDVIETLSASDFFETLDKF